MLESSLNTYKQAQATVSLSDDSTSLTELSWREFFTDPLLQNSRLKGLIELRSKN